MDEKQMRAALMAEALTWIGTPYHPSGGLKGVGVNCAQFIFYAARNAGALPADAPLPRWYTPQLATHSKEERLIDYILAYGATEILEAEVQPGDVVLYKSGQAHGHAAFLLEYPEIIHVLPIHGCQRGAVDEGRLGAMARRYFSLWRPACN